MSLIKVEGAVSQFAEQDQDLVYGSESQLQSTSQRQDKPCFPQLHPPSGSSCFSSSLLSVPRHGQWEWQDPLDSSIKRAGLIPFLESSICLVYSELFLGYTRTTLAVLLHLGELPIPHFYSQCKSDRILLQPPTKQKRRTESLMYVEIGYSQHRSHRLALLCKLWKHRKQKGRTEISRYLWWFDSAMESLLEQQII